MNISEFQSQLTRRLEERWKCPHPSGLPHAAIERLQDNYPNLPETYLSFLQTCGLEAGELFFGYNWKIEKRNERNEELQLQFEESDIEFDKQCFCFLDFMGDYFWIFVEGSDDPPVLIFDQVEVKETGFNLSDFLLRWDQLESPESEGSSL